MFDLELSPQIAQVLAMGPLWVAIHCAGMCGPLMVGLNAPVSGAHPALTAAARVLAYQFGRGITYASVGAASGVVGGAVEQVVTGVARGAGLVVALLLVGAGVVAALEPGGGAAPRAPGPVARMVRAALRLAPTRGVAGMAIVGMIMGFLPCALVFWALGLATTTGSALSGAGVMLTLLALTTPVLLLAGVAPQWVRHARWVRLRRRLKRLEPFALIFSGVWMGLVCAAANGWIAHLSWSFRIAGQPFMFMLW